MLQVFKYKFIDNNDELTGLKLRTCNLIFEIGLMILTCNDYIFLKNLYPEN